MSSNNPQFYSQEAEQSVLGGLMISPESFDEVCEKLNGKEFFQSHHREIFGAMKELTANSKPIDVITVSEYLNSKKSQIGLAQLGELAQNTPSIANLLAYAEIVKERHTSRELLKFTNETQKKLHNQDGRNLIEITNEIETELSMITAQADTDRSTIMTANDAVRDAILEMEEVKNSGGMLGLETGFADCDLRLKGLRKGDLFVIAARPSMGKTALLLNIIRHNIDLNNLIFSIEMPAPQIVQRMTSDMSGINYGLIRSAKLSSQEEWNAWQVAAKTIQQSPLTFDVQGGISFEQIKSRAKRFKRERGEIGFIAVDYLQLINLPSSDINYETARIITGMKAMAKELDCVVIALSQCSRGCENRGNKRPQMSDLRNSGEIEAAADQIAMIYRDEVYDENSPHKGIAEIIWRKVRAGETGTDNLLFNGANQRFQNMAYFSEAVA